MAAVLNLHLYPAGAFSERSSFVEVLLHVIAQWIRLHLPFCGQGFDSQAHHIKSFTLYCHCVEKRKKINKKRPGLVQIKKVLMVLDPPDPYYRTTVIS